jgi:hypothetical protein
MRDFQRKERSGVGSRCEAGAGEAGYTLLIDMPVSGRTITIRAPALLMLTSAEGMDCCNKVLVSLMAVWVTGEESSFAEAWIVTEK